MGVVVIILGYFCLSGCANQLFSEHVRSGEDLPYFPATAPETNYNNYAQNNHLDYREGVNPPEFSGDSFLESYAASVSTPCFS